MCLKECTLLMLFIVKYFSQYYTRVMDAPADHTQPDELLLYLESQFHMLTPDQIP